MGEEKFYALLQSKFKFPVDKNTMIPNVAKLHKILENYSLCVTSTAKEFKASDLYKSFKSLSN